eukprot:gene1686-2030_t
MQIRLILPGLDGCATPNSRSDYTKSSSAKATKKLRKLQGIACDAEEAHRGVIIDASLLQDDASSEGQKGNPACSSTASSIAGALASRKAASTAAQSGPSGSKRSGKQKLGAHVPSSIVAGGLSSKDKDMEAAGSRDAEAGLMSARCLASSGRQNHAGISVSTATGLHGPTAAANGRKTPSCSKPHVPIWERQTPAVTAEKKLVLNVPKVLQQVAVKTFSPTLGSLGVTIQSGKWAA